MRYKTVYADPPWMFNDVLDKTRRKPYPTLHIGELKKLPVGALVEESAHLYLWCPTTLIQHGLDCIKAWGFDYKTIIVWRKLTKHGKSWFGMGRYFRNSVELCLFGAKNNMRTKTKNTRNIFDAIKTDRHHSAKPEKMYEIIEANSEPPYIELFATSIRGGWTAWGWDIDQKDIRQKLNMFRW